MNEFLDKIAAVLEEPVRPETRFRELPDWSSLKAFGVLVTLENDFGRPMTIDEFRQLNTVADLARAAGVAQL